MKRLWIVRHAKAEPLIPGHADRLRPLSAKGRMDAERAGVLLAPQFPLATAVSSATRTAETAEAFARAAGCPFDTFDLRAEGYLADARRWWDWIETFDDSLPRGLVVGHNPGVSELVEWLTGMRWSLPTCGIVEVELPDRPWLQLAAGSGKVRAVVTPTSLLHG